MRVWKKSLSKPVKKDLIVPRDLIWPEIDAEGLFDYPDTSKGNHLNTFTMRLPKDPLLAAQIRVKPHREGYEGVSFDMEAHNERVSKALQPPISTKKDTT